jgi:hypothetical protein
VRGPDGSNPVWPFHLSETKMNAVLIPIFVIVQKGCVTEVRNVPKDVTIQVIDNDIEYVSPDAWKISPVDGEACTIQTFGPV